MACFSFWSHSNNFFLVSSQCPATWPAVDGDREGRACVSMATESHGQGRKGLRVVGLIFLGTNRDSEDPQSQGEASAYLLTPLPTRKLQRQQWPTLCLNTGCCISLWGRCWGLNLSCPPQVLGPAAASHLAGVYLSSSVGPGSRELLPTTL